MYYNLDIDFEELKKQKLSLLETITNLEDNGEDIDDLMGILHLIDGIQDYAVDELGIPEDEVFNLNDEEENEED